MSALPWIAYAVGYFLWVGYAINRFGDVCDAGIIIINTILALLWPVCVAVYVPYRVFRWVGVRPG
jgi:hypothetical protein